MSATATKARPCFFKVGTGYQRFVGHVVTTFMFRDEAMTRPIGWQIGSMSEGDTFKDGGGNVFVLTVAEQAYRVAA